MSGKERAIAGLLLAVAVAGGALIPRLLSAPAGRIGIALEPGPVRSVVLAPTIPQPTRRAAPPRVAPPAHVAVPSGAPAPVATVPAQPPATPTPAPAKRAFAPSPPPPPPPPPAPPLPPPPPSPPPPPPAAASQASTRPGHGYGDRNHTHTGPRSSDPAGVGRGQRSQGHDLPGSGHARPVQVPPHAVGAHDRGVGHLAAAPPATAPPAHDAGPNARPEARSPGSQNGPPPQVAHGHGR